MTISTSSTLLLIVSTEVDNSIINAIQTKGCYAMLTIKPISYEESDSQQACFYNAFGVNMFSYRLLQSSGLKKCILLLMKRGNNFQF